MHGAFVCTDPGIPIFGCKGGSVHVQELLRALGHLGIRLTVFARRTGGPASAGLSHLEVVQLQPLRSGALIDRERDLLAGNEELRMKLSAGAPFDFVYERYALWSFGAMEYAYEHGIPGLLEVNAPLLEEQSKFRRIVLVDEALAASRRCLRAASNVLPVSQQLRQWLQDERVEDARVHVVSNGVDTDRFSPSITPTRSAPEGVLTIGFVGSLRPWHGIEQLLDAYSSIQRTGRPVRLLIVGDGPAREHVESIDARVLETISLTGTVAPEEVPGFLNSMDIVVAPYPDLDGFYFSPLKLFEYMAAGRAIIASNIGQIPEVITDGVNGLLCRPGDSRSLVTAIERLCDDDGLRSDLGAAARREACAVHAWSRVAEGVVGIAAAARTRHGVRV